MVKLRQNQDWSIVWAIVVLATLLGYFPGGSDDLPLPPAPKGHKSIECSRCHAVIADINAPDTIPVIDQQCRTCHSAEKLQRHSLVTFHADMSRPCNDCHFFHRSDTVVAAGREFHVSTDRPQVTGTCASCHGPQENLASLSPGHRAAARIFHSELVGTGTLSPSDACLLCHSDRNRVDIAEFGDVPQFDGSHTHPVGVSMIPSGAMNDPHLRQISDPRIHLVDGKIECQTCHSLSSPTKYHLAGFSDQQQLCGACHQMNPEISAN